jgi:structural maintenance of chromosome 2
MEGLEVKVAFNNVWKESLTELSGGQRSLLALSLILALLLFKPAPMYILDEVDAALDLSHTQNIGMMLRQHFSKSQFIVVSLKEGMFNNANVIFKTRFVDGVSAVSRTVVGRGGVAPVDDDDDDVVPQKKARSKASASSRGRSAGAENLLEG